jgi:MoaA/NifB/PqqE/SkfB family radical SAM enzyme
MPKNLKDSKVCRELLIEISNKCYLNCRFCSSKANDSNQRFLNFRLIKEIIDDSIKLGVSVIQLSGGEPFTHPSFSKICKYIRKKNLPFIIYTSGNVRKKENLRPLDRKDLINLKKYDISILRFNIQSSREDVHNFLTDSNSFKNAIKSIRKAVKLNITCEVHLIPLRQNYRDLGNTLKFLLNLGVSKVKILRFVPHGRGLSNDEILSLNKAEYNELIKIFLRMKEEFGDFIEIGSAFNKKNENLESHICKKCQIGKNKIVITPDAKVYPCVSTKNFEFFNFNLKNISLYDTLDSNEYILKIRKFYSLINYGDSQCPTQNYIKINERLENSKSNIDFEKKENLMLIKREL